MPDLNIPNPNEPEDEPADTRIAHAWCWRTGAIDIAVLTGRSKPPRGAIVIAKGPASELRTIVEVLARHAYDGKTLLIPGVPEADDDDAAVDAVLAFKTQVRRRFDAGHFAAGAPESLTNALRQPVTVEGDHVA